MIVTVSPKLIDETESTATTFYAVAPEGNVSSGATPGEALDALPQASRVQKGAENSSPLLFILRSGQGDRFFTDAQNARLQTLRAHQKNLSLSSSEFEELDDLLQAEIRASGERAAFIAQQTASLV